jgi:hypothetical protein
MIPRPTRRRLKAIAVALRANASRGYMDGRFGYFDGRRVPQLALMRFCSVDVEEVWTRVMFTRDVGHHTSGWLKNPDYERCYHLSLSAAGPLPEQGSERRIVTPGGAGQLVGLDLKPLVGLPVQASELDRDLEEAWVDAFYGEAARYVWRESAKSDIGRRKAVWHYRVFCDETWTPIVPRGEVYSTEFTELGWQSWSELHAKGGPVVESTVDPS